MKNHRNHKVLGEFKTTDLYCELKNVELLNETGSHYLFVTALYFFHIKTHKYITSIWFRDVKNLYANYPDFRTTEKGMRKLLDDNFDNDIKNYHDFKLDCRNREIIGYFNRLEPLIVIEEYYYDDFTQWYKDCLPTLHEARKKKIEKFFK